MILPPKKILIIRFSSIGDIVLTTPIIRCLRKKYPDAKIHFLVKAKFKNIISTNPYINKFHFLKNDFKKITDELKEEKFDCVVDLHHNLRSWLIKRSLSVESFSFRKLNFEKWLLVNFKKDHLPRLHIVDRYFETITPLEVKNDNEGLDFFINVVDEVPLTNLPSAFSNGYIAIVLGGTFFTKRLTNEKVISIGAKINQPIVLLGGHAELENGIIITKALGNAKVYNAVNKYGIAQSASLINQAAVVITNDTGMMHIAAAFKKRIISVWGNTIPEFGMTPYYGSKELERKNSTIVQVKNLSCRPCSKLGYSSCPKKHFKCMNDIDEEQIIAAI